MRSEQSIETNNMKMNNAKDHPVIAGIFTKLGAFVLTERVADLLCSAFEGGSNYWVDEIKPVLPEGISYQDFREGGKYAGNVYYHPTQIIPFISECHLEVKAIDEDKAFTLNRSSLKKGLEVMFQKYPKHFANFMSEDDDAETGDVFLQCCLFAEIVYG